MGASRALTGAALGLGLGVVTAAALWQTGHGFLRPFAAGFGLLGAAGGLVVARRARWADGDVALFLDGKLRAGEVVATALELCREPADAVADNDRNEVYAVVVGQAAGALEQADPRLARWPVLAPWHVAIPVGIAAIGYLSWIPVPRLPGAGKPPGVDLVQLAEIKGLDKVEALARLKTPTDEQRRRLDKLSREASALREKLREGVERREALAEIARLQDALQGERLDLGDGARKQGLEAALARLAQDPLTREAAKVLGDRDLVRFDEEMQKLANAKEKSDRERAHKALEEAAEAAKKAGAADVGKALDRQKELLDERGKRMDELRALQEEMKGLVSDEDRQSLEDQGSPRDDKGARKLATALNDALKKLTPEQRKRLADNLKKRAEQGAMGGPGRENLRDLARQLDQQKLEEELKRLADEPTEDEDAERQEGLDEAQKGLGEAQGEMGGAPVPIPMPGQGAGQGDGKGDGKGQGGKGDGKGKGEGQGEGKGDGSAGPGGGKGEHAGKSRDVAADELRARAKARIDGRAPMAGTTIGRAAGREGETANVQGNGAIGKVGPGEVSGVDKNDVPDEYREQVGRYFQP
jgi:hypothetical protein